MGRLIASLFVLSLVVGLWCYGIWHQKNQVISEALRRDGFTEVRLTGTIMANGGEVEGFEGRDKWGVRCEGYVAPYSGGIIRVRTRDRSDVKSVNTDTASSATPADSSSRNPSP